MYIYDETDQRLVDERVAQFRDQTRRFLAGKLTEDEFKALRLRNGLYIQRYAPMLRVATWNVYLGADLLPLRQLFSGAGPGSHRRTECGYKHQAKRSGA